jgi:hypothetical protein
MLRVRSDKAAYPLGGSHYRLATATIARVFSATSKSLKLRHFAAFGQKIAK